MSNTPDAGQPVRRPDQRGRRAARAGHPHLRRPDEPRRVDPPRRSRRRARPGRATPTRPARHEQAPGSSLWAAQPVPHHGPSRRPRLDRRRRAGTRGRRSTRSPTRMRAPRNFGWPCYEGTTRTPVAATRHSASRLHEPHIAEPRRLHATTTRRASSAGTAAAPGSSSVVSGSPSCGPSSVYPTTYDNGLFFTDYSRKCIWFAPNSGGTRTSGHEPLREPRVDAARPTVVPVYLGITPDGRPHLHRLQPRRGPRRSATTRRTRRARRSRPRPSAGTAPADVHFDANGSSDPNGDTLTYAWDLDGDGQYDDATGSRPRREYNDPGPITVRLRVTDEDNLTRHRVEGHHRRQQPAVRLHRLRRRHR